MLPEGCGKTKQQAKAAVPVLVERLRKDEVEAVRSNSGGALGMIHAEPELVAPALIEAYLKEQWDDTRGVMMISLGQFGRDAKHALPVLRAAAKEPQNQGNQARMEQINRALEMIETNLKKLGAQAPQRE